MNDQKGILAVISGFSGAGKGTLVKELLTRHEQEYCLSISATTRIPREGEVDGQHYFFLDKSVFEQRIQEERFLEHACYVDNYYGTPKDFVFNKLSQGISVILEIEMQGALKVKERYPETVLIFVTPPTAEELEARLRGRGTETEEVILSRLSRASEEVTYMDKYDYIVLNENGKVVECAEDIHQIIEAEKRKAVYGGELVEQLTEGLAAYKKGE
ncbi:guanylate kinase [Frisingicoccus caecimuris]|uniref:Guanylate kinase n=1 Tax=Frisingicoccus caecimuris TaxID=1796636 RepID=A0A4R2LYA0_9FIRM|nr:guanylate kinase [Frisingicoccus caecimuris]MCR1918198.1 guanylate kinase [Frisingicoccus caecimuris]TCO85387.1 guanylate kinase [Frisingicoccus caecimuris]